MKKTVLLLILIGIASRAFGLLREIALSYYYGASNISDAYLISVIIPTLIFGLIINGISTGYIPIISSIQNRYGFHEELNFTNNLVNILLVLSTLILVFGYIFTAPLVKIFAFGFENNTLLLAIKFTRISLISIYFTGLICLFSGFLQHHKNFVSPALIGIPFNIFIVLCIIFSSENSPILLPISMVIATASQLILLLPHIHKNGYRYSFKINFRNKHLNKMALLTLPLILGVSVNQLNVIIDKTMASQIIIGGISALNYAERINGFIQGIFVLSISTVVFPLFSKMAVENNMDKFKETLTSSICGIGLLVIPCTVGAMVFSEPIIKLLYGRGAFDFQAFALTSNAFYYYSIGMIGFGLREILSKAFFSLQDSKTPMVNALIAVFTNIILSLILSKFLGIGGLALATSISGLLCSFLLMVSLRSRIGQIGLRQISLTYLKILISSIIMGFLGRVTYYYITGFINYAIALMVCILISSIYYLIIIYFMKIKEFNILLKVFKRQIILMVKRKEL